MTGNQESLRMDLRAQRLGNAEDYSPGDGAPQGTCASNYGRLEGKNELKRSGVRIEGRPHRHEHAGDPDGHDRDGGGDRIGAA